MKQKTNHLQNFDDKTDPFYEHEQNLESNLSTAIEPTLFEINETIAGLNLNKICC